jgi:type-F conjugative transfer system pilin assembly protein TrbC
MLSAHVLNRLVSGIFAALICGFGLAAAAQVPSFSGSQLSATQEAQLEQMTRAIQQRAAQGAADPEAQQAVTQISRRVDDIANKEMATERAKILRFLGINPEGRDSLYIFVSWSMPLDMLRAYAVEAMWTGGALVFRGVPPGRTIPDFFLKDLKQLVYDKGASAIISLDPRLYDTYGVTAVPAVVLTSDRSNLTCIGAGEHKVTSKGKSASYSLCPPMDGKKYWKMSGAVTLDYALESFKAAGSPGVDTFLNALKKAYQDDKAPPREQQPFKGEWKDAPTPSKLMKAAPAASSSSAQP